MPLHVHTQNRPTAPVVPAILVVGGANLDVKCAVSNAFHIGTSNPGRVWQVDGGVGRNIVENLAALGARTRFLGPFGDDAAGPQLKAHLEARGVDTRFCPTLAGQQTGTYVAVLDDHGDLAVAVSDMRIMDAFDASVIAAQAGAFADVDVVCLDANVRLDAIAEVLAFAARSGARVVLEPVSVAKAARVAASGWCDRIHTVTPNKDELAAMSGRSVESTADIRAAADVLLQMGVQRVVVTLGAQGVYCKSVADAHDSGIWMEAQTVSVTDVTGAGDAFTAGLVYGLAANWRDEDAVTLGQTIATELVQCADSVLRGNWRWDK